MYSLIFHFCKGQEIDYKVEYTGIKNCYELFYDNTGKKLIEIFDSVKDVVQNENLNEFYIEETYNGLTRTIYNESIDEEWLNNEISTECFIYDTLLYLLIVYEEHMLSYKLIKEMKENEE